MVAFKVERWEVRCYRSDLVHGMVFEVGSWLNVLLPRSYFLLYLENVPSKVANFSVFWLALGSLKKDLYPWDNPRKTVLDWCRVGKMEKSKDHFLLHCELVRESRTTMLNAFAIEWGYHPTGGGVGTFAESLWRP